MPRGKNYVNQNKGMTLTAHQRKSDGAKKEACLYGPACTRKDCIYDHSSTKPEFQKSSDPCMAYLAGQCLFTAPTCRKRHPPPHECDLLRVKYAKTTTSMDPAVQKKTPPTVNCVLEVRGR